MKCRSKNFVNQKFRLRCHAQSEKNPKTKPRLNDVFSRPIESRSKRPQQLKSSCLRPPLRPTSRPSEVDDSRRNALRILLQSKLKDTKQKIIKTNEALHDANVLLQKFVKRLSSVEDATERFLMKKFTRSQHASIAIKCLDPCPVPDQPIKRQKILNNTERKY
mmetsp:Transcript_27801/g.67608  ORF Transcript_27801/g.67608 Transcript_27801/m.67608 type:complete len:163 (+) Transcript_27801:461-949(+)